MVSLPSIESYSEEQKTQLGEYSPVFSHYLNLVQKKPSEFADQIRILKHQHWLECALATFCSNISSENICTYWSMKTDKILQKVWKHCQLSEEHVALLAFGKLGSQELNLSSDIDIVFAKSNDFDDPKLNAKIRNFIRILSEPTLYSFAYRVDLNLRPGGENTPLVPTKQNFYNFYDEYLEPWHRLSFIRTRSLNTSSKLDRDLISYCKKRCFPKRLDFSIIQSIKSIRSKIKIKWRQDNEPFDIKLQPGGIRDIELYIHSLQVIYGGKHREIQTSRITEAIRLLEAKSFIPKEEAQFLLSFYWKLRKLENLIHIKNDQHTYLVTEQDLAELKFLGLEGKELASELAKSESIVSDFFSETASSSLTNSQSLENVTPLAQKAIDEILQLKSHSIKKMGLEKIKNEILSQFLSQSNDIGIDRDFSVQVFRDFIFAIKSKKTIFYLLERNPDLINHLAWLFSVSPFAGQLLCRRPELIDSFVLGQVIVNPLDDLETFWENLVDYKLLGQLTALVDLFKNKDLWSYLNSLSNQADYIVSQLQNKLCSELNCDPLDVLCMGKWSGKELGIRSDLDFVLLAEKTPDNEQKKMARRLINTITNQSPAGRLYEIDLRLKPNASAGPLIIEKDRLLEFIKNKAEPWQKQAYLRSRLINQDHFFLKPQFNDLRIENNELQGLRDILKKLIVHHSSDSLDIKYSPGGLIESEFLTQQKCLLGDTPPNTSQFTDIVQSLGLETSIESAIVNNYQELRFTEQVFQICTESTRTKVRSKSENLKKVSTMMGREDIFSYIKTLLHEQGNTLKSLDLNP